MIYTTGTIAVNGNTVTGTGTNFTQAGSLIRVGCTIIVMSSPVQVFQTTSINSATQLTVTPAASPEITSGTRYSILLSDSLSVDGLAQSIAETFTMYQKQMSGFADVMNANGDVTITINGAAVTVPGQKSLVKKQNNLSDLQDKTAARKNIGLDYTLSLANPGGGIVRLLSYNDSGLMTITRRLLVSANPNSSTRWEYNWKSDIGVSFVTYPGFSVNGMGGFSGDWSVGTEATTGDGLIGYIKNTGASAVAIWLTIIAIGVKA